MPLSLKNRFAGIPLPFIFPRHLLFCLIFCGYSFQVNAYPVNHASPADSVRISSIDQAVLYLQGIPLPDSSLYWPNVRPVFLMENLSLYLRAPLYAFENKNTNFCGYTAISFITFEQDPLGFIKFMLQLYKEGKAEMGRTTFKPSAAVRKMAGNMKYKGMLDINPATQMWLLTLADHFKGYLNSFNTRYNEGDENTMWASTNFAKFNRMLRRLFNWEVHARGADLVRPSVGDLFTYLEERMKKGTVFLYLNNRLLYKKKHVGTRFGIPTHYVLLKEISKEEDKINITYMDGGRKTQQQVSPAFLKKIVFGITWCTNK